MRLGAMRWSWLALAGLLLVGCKKKEAAGTPLVPDGLWAGYEFGDPLQHRARSNTSTFFEITDVEAIGKAVYTCTGVSSLVLHDARSLAPFEPLDLIRFPLSHGYYPRCSHLDRDGDWMIVATHKDEIQTTPFIGLVNVSDPFSPRVADSLSFPNLLIEEAAVVGTRVFVALTADGVRAYDIDDGDLTQVKTVGRLGTVTRVSAWGRGVAAGTTEGQVHLLDRNLQKKGTIEVGASVTALLDLEDGRMVAALGSRGLALIDLDTRQVLDTIDTHGTALRLDRTGDGSLVVANWSDVRLYDTEKLPRTLLPRAVDAVFQANPRPRHLGAAASGDLVFAGEWEGLHALAYKEELVSAELTPSDLQITVPADGKKHTAHLTVHNDGQMDLAIGAMTYGTAWTVVPDEFTVPPGDSQDVELTYAGGTDVIAPTLTIHNNDPDEAQADIQLRVGSDRVFVGDPAPDFAYQAVNAPGTHRLSDQRGKVVLLAYFATF